VTLRSRRAGSHCHSCPPGSAEAARFHLWWWFVQGRPSAVATGSGRGPRRCASRRVNHAGRPPLGGWSRRPSGLAYAVVQGLNAGPHRGLVVFLIRDAWRQARTGTDRRVRRLAPIPTAPPRLRRRPSPWLRRESHLLAAESTVQTPGSHVLHLDLYPPDLSGSSLIGVIAGSSRTPSRLAGRTRPSVWPSRHCQGCFPPSPASPRSGCAASAGAAPTTRRGRSHTSPRTWWRLMAHDRIHENDRVGDFGASPRGLSEHDWVSPGRPAGADGPCRRTPQPHTIRPPQAMMSRDAQ
jgi:hypothetical protein